MFLSLLFAAMTAAPQSIKVDDFGAKPNTFADSTTAVAKAIAAAKPGTSVEFSQGEYHFYRDNGTERNLFLSNSDVANPRKIAILVEGRKGLHLQGHGTRLIFHDRIMPFAILGSEKISLDGFTIDWERPLMSQGTVVQSGPDGFTLDIDKRKYPFKIEGGHLLFTDTNWKRRVWAFMEFDHMTRGVAYGTGDGGFTDGDWSGANVTEPQPGIVRFDYKCSRYPKVGNILVARHGVRDQAGTFIADSKDIQLSNVFYRHTSGLGVLCQYTENLSFNHVDVAPEPMTDRVFAGHDDGFHFSNCKGHIAIDNCHFEGLMDDPINIHGTSVQVIEKLSPTKLKCRFMHNQSVGMRFGDSGDTLSYLDHESMISRGKGKIVGVKHLTAEDFTVDVTEPVPNSLNVGDALENLTWTPSATIRNTEFGCVRARGLLVSTPRKVLIEGCVFRSSGAAILISGDANGWFESGAVNDVTIRHNRFENCNTSGYQFGDAVISIHPEIPKPSTTPFHHGITIEGNTFYAFDAPLVWALSVGNLKFIGNTVNQSKDYKPFHPDSPCINLIVCEDVQIDGNKFDPGFPRPKIMATGCNRKTIVYNGQRLGN